MSGVQIVLGIDPAWTRWFPASLTFVKRRCSRFLDDPDQIAEAERLAREWKPKPER